MSPLSAVPGNRLPAGKPMRTALSLAAWFLALASAGAAELATPPKAAEISPVTRSRQFGGQREDFRVGPKQSAGFVVLPPKPATDGSKPWIWYAPTFVSPHGSLPR